MFLHIVSAALFLQLADLDKAALSSGGGEGRDGNWVAGKIKTRRWNTVVNGSPSSSRCHVEHGQAISLVS